MYSLLPLANISNVGTVFRLTFIIMMVKLHPYFKWQPWPFSLFCPTSLYYIILLFFCFVLYWPNVPVRNRRMNSAICVCGGGGGCFCYAIVSANIPNKGVWTKLWLVITYGITQPKAGATRKKKLATTGFWMCKHQNLMQNRTYSVCPRCFWQCSFMLHHCIMPL